MADREPTPVQPRSAPQPRTQQAPPASDAVDVLRGLAAAVPSDATGQGQEVGNAGDEARGSSPSTEDSTIEVEHQGARKRVPVKEILSKAKKAEELEARTKVMEELLEKHSAASPFVKAIDAMSPEDQEAFAKVLANPSLARQLVGKQPQRDQEVEAEEEVIEGLSAFTQPKRQAAPPPPVDDAVRQTLGILLEDYRQRQTQQQTQTLEQQIEQTMDAYPGLKDLEPEGRKFAKQSISNALARNPKAPMDDVVAQHAAQFERMLGARSAAANVPGAQPRTFQPQDPGKPFTADDLLGGRIGKDLLSAFRRGL